jgi:hypothetical protein
MQAGKQGDAQWDRLLRLSEPRQHQILFKVFCCKTASQCTSEKLSRSLASMEPKVQVMNNLFVSGTNCVCDNIKHFSPTHTRLSPVAWVVNPGGGLGEKVPIGVSAC